MDTADLDNKMIEVVRNQGPIKGTFLIVEFVKAVYNDSRFKREDIDKAMEAYDINTALDRLVFEQKIGEIEYTNPGSPQSLKSLFCSTGTRVRVLGLKQIAE